MYKNQLQELAQRSCFNLPSYTCIREGPDHAPRFKAIVHFSGENFESPNYCSTLRQAEHSAAEVALVSLSSRGPTHSLASRILDETGVYKNLLQEISQRVGAPLPHYITFRSGVGHHPVFTGKVELAGITFTGEPAKNKKQAEKNAAMAAWQSLKQLAQQTTGLSSEQENSDELEQVSVARALLSYRLRERMTSSSSTPQPFPHTFPVQSPRPPSPQRTAKPTSKILPLIFPKKTPPQPLPSPFLVTDNVTSEPRGIRPQRLLGVGATPYIPIRHPRPACYSIAPPVTIRNAMFCCSSPPVRIAPPVSIRQSVPLCSPLPVSKAPQPNKAVDKVDPVQKSAEKESKESQIPEPVCIRQTTPVRDDQPAQQEVPESLAGPVEGEDCGKGLQGSESLAKLEQIKL
ncbi:double-stranded RNA-binding protein 2-like isoform X2 [Silene latifolia]|uniref:double-stranded RNA-binding protein 2-like isoform X2 n=1 Tax=Silene latifolia TaxID=37657 RepID=UPI003D78647C